MDYIQLTPWDLALATLLIGVPAIISIALKLGLEKNLALASVRTIVQLALLGLVLEWVFSADRWFYVLPMLAVMLFFAARAGIKRSSRRFPGAFIAAFGALTLATSVTTFSVTEIILDVDRWYEPQYIIPLMGMLLGNGLTGISLGLDRMLSDITAQRRTVEARLALGSTLWQATLPWLRQGLRNGMIPIINAMMIVGLVSLPGMMTGQILAGVDPAHAVAYQILIMFMIAAATAMGVIILCLIAFYAIADPFERVRWDRISRHDS